MDQTEKGWFIAYVDRDPETVERQKVRAAVKNSGDRKHIRF